MIPVGQRQTYQPESHPDGPQRGDCLRCCVASIFEVPYEDVESIGPSTQHVYRWVSEHFPDKKALCRYLTDPEDDWKPNLDAYLAWPTSHVEPGFWIATIWSPRIPDTLEYGCGCASKVPGGDPECQWCHGKPDERFLGVAWGLHAVVMEDDHLAWDPHPDATEGQLLYIRDVTTFEERKA